MKDIGSKKELIKVRKNDYELLLKKVQELEENKKSTKTPKKR
jgi:hypothetical protein